MDAQPKLLRLKLLDVSYYDLGRASDPPVILLHGFPDDPNTWNGVAHLLAGEPLRLLIPWLRGFGKTLPQDAAKSGQANYGIALRPRARSASYTDERQQILAVARFGHRKNLHSSGHAT